MFEEHYIFELPKDEDTKIWKYLDLTRFLSILENKALYFCRSDKLDDPFEGTIPLKSLRLIDEFFKDVDNSEAAATEMKRIMSITRKMTLINCWHINDYESDAMWRIYAHSGLGLAVQSTIKSLKDSFHLCTTPIHIGKVKYIDFDRDIMESLNGLAPYIYKRKSFEHEHELRAVLWYTDSDVEIEKMEVDKPYPISVIEDGKYVEVDVDIMINEIYVSPTAPSWYTDLVKKILVRYNLNKEAIQSNLYKIPELGDTKNTKDVKERILVNKTFLEHFSKKDTERVALEREGHDRLIKLQHESLIYSYEEIERCIEKLDYKARDGKTYRAKEALTMFAGDVKDFKNKNDLISSSFFQEVYFLTGKFEKLYNEIESSLLLDEEKMISFKRLFHLYTSSVVQPLTYIIIVSEKNKFEDQTIELLGDTFRNFYKFIQDNKI